MSWTDEYGITWSRPDVEPTEEELQVEQELATNEKLNEKLRLMGLLSEILCKSLFLCQREQISFSASS